MNKNRYLSGIKYLIVGIGMLFTTSCDKDLLNQKPLDAAQESEVWGDPNLVISYVNSRYNQIGNGWYSESWMSSMCDETYLTWSRDCEPINQGYVSASFIGSMNGGHWGEDARRWDHIWRNIASCNAFFDNVDKVPFDSSQEELKKQLTAEVTFIRALMYWDLVNRWGGLPIITKSYTFETVSEIARIKRNSYKENIDFIISECDKAAAVLPSEHTGFGRATSISALALKSRVLLYAASDLMNDSRTDDPNFLVHYQTPDPNRWTKAATAAQDVITKALANGYALFDKYDNDVKQKYSQLFLEGGNSEVLFDRQGGASPTGTSLTYIDQANGPNGYGQWGGNTPISEFVDDFEMADGTKFDWTNPVHKANPYANRDGRLHATVLTNGDEWYGRPVETFFFKKADGSESGGLDTQYGSSSWNTSKTAYNVHKFMDPNFVLNSWNFNPKNWIWFRLGEMYLNLAEALYRSNNETDAKIALNKIRDRARMPQITSGGTDLLNAIYHERRIELAFEEHRYFDVRRWKIAEDVLNRNATGVRIFREADMSLTYTTGVLAEKRKFKAPEMYWLPIPNTEIIKNPELEQNPGY